MKTAAVIAVLGTLPACSSFDERWERECADPPPADPLAGCWGGAWESEVTGHTGSLRAIVTPAGDGRYTVSFHATYSLLLIPLTFDYDLVLETVGEGRSGGAGAGEAAAGDEGLGARAGEGAAADEGLRARGGEAPSESAAGGQGGAAREGAAAGGGAAGGDRAVVAARGAVGEKPVAGEGAAGGQGGAAGQGAAAGSNGAAGGPPAGELGGGPSGVREGGVVRFRGEADLGWLAGGVYTYEGEVHAGTWRSTYRSKTDHGVFRMERQGG